MKTAEVIIPREGVSATSEFVTTHVRDRIRGKPHTLDADRSAVHIEKTSRSAYGILHRARGFSVTELGGGAQRSPEEIVYEIQGSGPYAGGS